MESVVTKDDDDEDLLDRIGELGDLIKELEIGDEKREKVIMLLDQIEFTLKEKVLTDSEKQEYFERLDKMIRPRFGNYKKKCPLKIHYSDMVDEKIHDIVSAGYYPCQGICSPLIKCSPCRNNLVFDPLVSDLVILEFDHYLEKSQIYEEMERQLTKIVYTEEFLQQCPLAQNDPGYIKKYFKDPQTNERNKAIYKLVNEQVNLQLYKDDLYGSNITVRCKLCHNACKSHTHHPSVQAGRYERK